MKYNGITANNGTFKVQLSRKGKLFYLGNFPNEVLAAMAYDRAVLISAPWTDRRYALNFDESVCPAEDKWNKYEQNMITHLRSYFPDAETDAKERSALDSELPDVLFKHFRDLTDRNDEVHRRFRDVLRSAEQTIRSMGAQIVELKQSKKFYADKLAESESTISRLRSIKHEDGKPKFKITPVVPKGIVAEKFEERRNAVVLPDAPASPVQPVFVNPPIPAPVAQEPILAPAIEALRQIVLDPAEEGQAVEGSVITDHGVEEGSEADQKLEEQPIYPEVPGAKNPPQNGDEESGENAGFSKE